MAGWIHLCSGVEAVFELLGEFPLLVFQFCYRESSGIGLGGGPLDLLGIGTLCVKLGFDLCGFRLDQRGFGGFEFRLGLGPGLGGRGLIGQGAGLDRLQAGDFGLGLDLSGLGLAKPGEGIFLGLSCWTKWTRSLNGGAMPFAAMPTTVTSMCGPSGRENGSWPCCGGSMAGFT